MKKSCRAVFTICLLTFAALAFSPASARAQTPTPLPTFALSRENADVTAPRLLFDKRGNLHALWDEKRQDGIQDVIHRQRNPSGNWSDATSLTQGFEIVFDGSSRLLLNPSGDVCAFFQAATQATDPGTLGLYMRCLVNNAWTPAQFVARTPGTHRDDFPVFAPDGSIHTLYLVDAGTLYFQDVRLSDDQASAYMPALVTDSGNGYHAFWTRQGSIFTLEQRFSRDYGKTWERAETVSPPGVTSAGQMGVAAGPNETVHLVWQTFDGKIIYRRLDKNTGWTAPVELQGDGAANNAPNFGIAVSPDGRAAVTWQGINEIRYVEQKPDGAFTAPISLNLAQGGGAPQIAIDANSVRHFVWRQTAPSPRLFYATMPALVASPLAAAPASGALFNSPFFQNHIYDPSILTTASPATLATNFAFALILALAMGFFGNLLNDTLESNEARVAQTFGPLQRLALRARAATHQIDANLRARRLHWLAAALKIAGLLFVFGAVYAFVDPSFSFANADALLVILALALSIGLISLIDDLAQYIVLRHYGETPALRIHIGNAALAFLSAFGSRLFTITPGILIGSPAGIEEVRETKLDAYLHLVAMGAIAVVAIGAWLAAPIFATDLFVTTILLLIFAVGVQTLFFEMLPLQDLHGKSIFQFNRLVWLVTLALVAWLFLSTMLNPKGEFLASFTQPNMTALAGLVGAFCVCSAGVWFYFNRQKK